MITVSMGTTIAAGSERVWRALTNPAELASWKPGVVASIDAPADYPQPGQRVRWRFRLRRIPLVLHDGPVEVVPHARLRSSQELGPFRFDETYTLESGDGGTRLGLRLVTPNIVPLVGGALDRFAVRELAMERVDLCLRSLRAWCEGLDG